MNTNKTQILYFIRLRKFTTDTPLEDIYANQKFHPDDDVVIPEVDLYSILWEAESNHLNLDHRNLYSDPVTL